MTKELAVASRQRTVSHLRFHQGISFTKKYDWHLPTPYFSVSPIEDKTGRLRF
jgi:hypothetical protein